MSLPHRSHRQLTSLGTYFAFFSMTVPSMYAIVYRFPT